MKTQELNFVSPLRIAPPGRVNRIVLRHFALMIVLLNLFSVGMLRAHIFTELHSFGIPELSGANPDSLVQGSDGFLYGTTASSQGVRHTLFRLNPANNQKTVLHIFGSPLRSPRGLIEGPGGALYGIADLSMSSNRAGGVFRMERDGSGLSLIATFTGVTNYYPICLATDGQVLYGTTLGTRDGRGAGTVFRLNGDGSGYSMLRTFPAGVQIPIRLISGEGNVLFGLTYFGGSNNRGTVFRINTDGTDYQVIHNCNTVTANPNLLIQGPAGRLYGTTHLTGILFGMNPDGTAVTILRGLGARVLTCSLFAGANGYLYGATRNGGANGSGQVFAIQPEGTGFMSLHEFPISSNASWPVVMIQGADHALYGCTQQGGVDPASGVIFKLNADGGGYANIHEFQIAGGDGASPSSLLEARDGRLYGTTWRGGTHGYGLIFKQDRDGSGYSVIHHFDNATGISPNELVQGDDGALYGTTHDQGGTVFKINTDGTGFRTLHQFGGDGDGAAPMGLIRAEGGVFYGVTTEGGAHGDGIAFKINADGSGYTALHSFPHKLTRMPVVGSDGALYGTTDIQTLTPTLPSLFRISPDGVYTVLATALGQPTLMKGIDGALYGYAMFVISNSSDYSLTNTYYKLDPANGDSRIEWFGEDWSSLMAAREDAVVYSHSGILRIEVVRGASRLERTNVLLMDLKDARSSSGVINQLVCGRDGVYYGTASGSVELGFGTVFSFELSPRMSLGDRRRELNRLVARANGDNHGAPLTLALRSLDAALDPVCWADDDHVAKKAGHRVFHHLKDTLRKLEVASADHRSPVSKDAIIILMERIAKASETLSQMHNP